MHKRKYLILSLVSILAIIFYVIFFPAKPGDLKLDNDNWRDEILYASECGLDGLQCCVDTETPCLYGLGCCVSPNDPLSTYCSDDCVFGKENTFCREEDPKCDPGSVCSNGYCQLAGGNKQPCLPDQKCEEGLVCGDGICVECGITGNPCCEVGDLTECQNENIFDDARTECSSGICSECGFSLKPGCLNEPVCNLGNLENNGKCLQCGGYNQPCCKTDNKGALCEEGKNLDCVSGFCSNK